MQVTETTLNASGGYSRRTCTSYWCLPNRVFFPCDNPVSLYSGVDHVCGVGILGIQVQLVAISLEK